MQIKKGGVAFFDSGIGGLTVLHACREVLKGETVYYYGDNAHAPYGNLPTEKIKKYVEKAFRLFKRLEVKAVVVACNTATAVCVKELRGKYSFPIIGAEPAIFCAPQNVGEIFVLSTRATYKSERFHSLCVRARNSGRYPKPFACDALAGEIERHIFDKSYSYSNLFPLGNPSAVILGCTHYIYIKEEIARFYHCQVFDGNDGIAKRLYTILSGGGDFADKRKKMSKKTVKFWDGRPPGLFFDKKRRRTAAQPPRISKGNNTNKCSWLKKIPEVSNVGKIYFLGSGKKRNFAVFKHMFGFEIKKSGFLSQKN